jgi:hypothetical protein
MTNKIVKRVIIRKVTAIMNNKIVLYASKKSQKLQNNLSHSIILNTFSY